MQPPTPPPPPAPSLPPAPPAVPEAEAQALADAAAAAAAAQNAEAGAAVVVSGTRALPRTAQELRGLRQQRSELSTQLNSALERRSEIARALRRADGPARAGLEQRLSLLDRRILQLEGDLAETGRLITSAPPALLAGTEVPVFRRSDGGGGPPEGVIAVVFILFVLFPIALALSRGIWRRSRVGPPDGAARESAERLARLEQAVDAIAIEVERVSEGQRFVTRLLSESRQEPIPVAAGDRHELASGRDRR